MRKQIQNIDLSIRKIAEKADQKQNTVRFDIGQPSFDTPQHVKEAAKEALENKQGYSPILGLKELRSAISDEENQKNGYGKNGELIEEEHVMVTTGGMGALYAIFAARLDSESIALFNDPCWGPYKMISEVNGNQWQQIQYWDENRNLTEKAKQKIKKADVMVVNTPENPTGYMLTREQAKEIGEVADKHDTFLISDEVYHRLTFDKEHYSPAEFSCQSAVIGSVSKNHAMTGWRIGWVIDKQENIEQYAKVSRASTACPPLISQYAAIQALENDSHVQERNKIYKERRDILVKRMKDIEWSFKVPEGAIYAFPEMGQDSWDFCLEMVEDGVAMVPGEPMGPGSDQNVRICFGSVTKKEINKAFDILEDKKE